MFERVYRVLLKLYPEAFRREFEREMLQLYRDRLASEGRGFARARLQFEILWDFAISLPREYRRGPESEPLPGAYRLSEEAVRQMTAGRSEAFAAVLASAVGLGLGYLGDAPRWALAVLGVLSVLGAWGALRMKGRLRRHWSAYALRVDGERLQMTAYGRPGVALTRSEITRVAESPGGHGFPGGLVIRGEGGREIWAPSLLTGYEELRSLVGSWASIEPLPARPIRISRLAKLGHSGLPFGMWLFAATLLVRSPWVFVPLAALIGAPLSYATARMLRANVPVPAKIIPAAALAVLLVKVAVVAW